VFPRRTLSLLFVSLPLAASAAPVDFAREIQPILSENCYHCHGPDAGAREAKLRLDTKEGAYRTLDGVTVVKPGDTAASDLVVRILSDDKDEVMPPPKSHRQLSAAQKTLLKRWVEEGAPWGEHWAFIAPRRPAVGPIADLRLPIADWKSGTDGFGDWSGHPIDGFVLKRLAHEKLMPSREAPPEKLIRRMTLDLTGLPPTSGEVDAFVKTWNADPSIANRQSAIGNLADRLLASPRYGERMVWEWLDAARYADTNGYQNDPTRAMWYWRDWAIKALNDNLPYDQFTIEQLAGDLLQAPTREQLIATGFHRNHMINGEGGRIAEESRVENVMDRTETTGTVWMGLTLQCCRCHDHKFDQLKQKEYYSLSAFFNSIDETGGNDAGGLANPIISLSTPEQKKKVDDLAAKESEAKKAQEELEKTLRAGQPEWERTLTAGGASVAPVEWETLHPEEANSEAGATLTVQPDGAVVVSGANPDADEFLVMARTRLKNVMAVRIEALPGEGLVNGGPGRADNGNFVLSELVVLGGGGPPDLEPVSADFEQKGWPLKDAFDGKNETGWAVQPAFGKPHTAIIAFKKPFNGYRPEEVLSFRMIFRSPNRQHTLGRFRISITNAPTALLRPMPETVKAALAVFADQRSDEQTKAVADFYLGTDGRMLAAKKTQDAAKAARETAEKALPKTMVMRERAKPRETFLLVKGNYEAPAGKVAHGVPAFLPKLPEDAPANRLALARWLVAPEHPLTARVTVNRYWQMFFGTGLVKTTEDFGVQGEQPIQPELLDWLAVEFRESGWDVKKLLRLIVTSATYRQSSKVLPGMAERDPENRLLARGPRHRLPSWMLRDQALAASGLLVEKVGGPPVKGYQPEGVWEDATFGQIKYQQDHGDALYRRSLYTFWRRIVGPTMFFDVSNRQTCTVKVGQTNTPLHALVTLNDITFTEAARALAGRMLREGGASDTERLAFGFRACTSRVPGEQETPILAQALATLRRQYAADPAAAKKLIATGESKPDAKLDAVELAAHTGLASLLLNLDETLTNE